MRDGSPRWVQVLQQVRDGGWQPNRRPAPLCFARVLHPKHLAEKILTSKSSLEGERKQVWGRRWPPRCAWQYLLVRAV